MNKFLEIVKKGTLTITDSEFCNILHTCSTNNGCFSLRYDIGEKDSIPNLGSIVKITVYNNTTSSFYVTVTEVKHVGCYVDKELRTQRRFLLGMVCRVCPLFDFVSIGYRGI